MYYRSFGKYKGLETGFRKLPIDNFFNFDISWTRNCDHPGFYFFFAILGYSFEFNFYDGRHWNYKEHRFFYDGEEADFYKKELE